VPPAPWSGAVLPAACWDYYRQRERHEARYEGGGLRAPPPLRHTADGDFKTLVLLLRFADHDLADLPERDDIASLFNDERGVDAAELLEKEAGNEVNPTGSVRDVYSVNSRGALRVVATVTPWISLDHDEAYYASDEEGEGQSGLGKSRFRDGIREALDKLAADPDAQPEDFDDFDYVDGKLEGLGVVHSGHGAEYGGAEQDLRIWSHKSSGLKWEIPDGEDRKAEKFYVIAGFHGKESEEMLRMGTLCHELGHTLGLADLYDTSFNGNGIGNFDFMAKGNYGFDNTGYYPSSMSAYSKAFLGWADVVEIEEDGEYTLEAAGETVYKISAGFEGTQPEYLLLENRQPVAYDSAMTGGGIAVYHVDENVKKQNAPGYPGMPENGDGDSFPENSMHYRVALLSADGAYALERGETEGNGGDLLWHADSKLKEIGTGADGSFPNTEGYEGGNVEGTGVRIYDFSESGPSITFKVEGIESRRGAARLRVPGANGTREARG